MKKFKRIAVAVAILWCCTALFAEDAKPISTLSAPIQGARFEIIQSPLTISETFKLDRFTGRVYQAVRPHEGGVDVWALTSWWQPATVNPNPTEPRFQLFIGGERVADVYLLDSMTGGVWVWALVSGQQLTATSTDFAWVPMRDVVIKPKSGVPERTSSDRP